MKNYRLSVAVPAVPVRLADRRRAPSGRQAARGQVELHTGPAGRQRPAPGHRGRRRRARWLVRYLAHAVQTVHQRCQREPQASELLELCPNWNAIPSEGDVTVERLSKEHAAWYHSEVILRASGWFPTDALFDVKRVKGLGRYVMLKAENYQESTNTELT